MKIQITLEIEETDAALIWDDQWGESERLSIKTALERALEAYAIRCNGCGPTLVAAMRKMQADLQNVPKIGTIHCGRDTLGLDLRVMRRDLERKI